MTRTTTAAAAAAAAAAATAATAESSHAGDSPLPGRFPAPPELLSGGEQLLQRLDVRVNRVVARLMGSPSWRALMEAEDAGLSSGVLREVYREVIWFFSAVIESGLVMSGKLAWVDTRLMRELVEHLAEETLHRKTAMDGYLALGGATKGVEDPMSSSAFAVASVWRGLERMASPLTYLGAMLLFEASTPQLCQPLSARLKAIGVSAAGAHHVNLHVTADIEHSALFRRWIVRLVNRDPATAAAIEYGMYCLAAVYPQPVFDAAYARAAAEPAEVAPSPMGT
jgi:hypothetical protein